MRIGIQPTVMGAVHGFTAEQTLDSISQARIPYAKTSTGVRSPRLFERSSPLASTSKVACVEGTVPTPYE